MRRMLGAVVVGLIATAVAQAHFPFIVPDGDGSTVTVVFSDDLKPDPKVEITKLAGTKLTMRDASGKDTPLEMKKGDGFYAVAVPGTGPRVVYGVTEYGVLQRGDSKPFRLTYCPKALIGGVSGQPAVGGALKVEIIPSGESGKTRFQVLHAGKPAAEVEVTVMVPGGDKKAVKTDKEGFTPVFESTGRYGVYARVTVSGGGEFAGKKFEETRFYSTLVVDVK